MWVLIRWFPQKPAHLDLQFCLFVGVVFFFFFFFFFLGGGWGGGVKKEKEKKG